MEHIFCGLDPYSIAIPPFTPMTTFQDETFDLIDKIILTISPCVAGYIGGDITAGLLASEICQKDGNYLYLDIGTNGEIVLKTDSGILSCSVASGPAFEGGNISSQNDSSFCKSAVRALI